MVYVPVTVLGGLPVIADVWFSGPDYWGEYDAGVDGLYWQKRDGSRGKELSTKVMERIEKEQYWDADVTEKANDWLSFNVPTYSGNTLISGSYSEEFLQLNHQTTK